MLVPLRDPPEQGSDVKSRPKYGQNFLVDRSWQRRIVESFQPRAQFGEIGPGRGALTNLLKQKYSGFVVFEIDKELAEFHRSSSSYQLVEGDFLDWDFCLNKKAVENFSLIGNLPYESGTAILLKVIEHVARVEHFVFMLQREVVERITARPTSRAYGALSVISQLFYEIENIGLLKPGAFHPSPKVDSMLIRGQRRSEPPPYSAELRSFIFEAFRYKRKTLRNCLKEKYSSLKIEALYASFEWPSNIRSEEIEVNRWWEIFKRLHG